MPELPEVETIRRGLAPHIVGHSFARVQVRRRDLRRPIPKDFGPRITGRRVESLDRRAKYLLFRLEGGTVILCHLGMSGTLVLTEPETKPATHDHVVLDTDADMRVMYNDPRRFGLFALCAAEALDSHPLIAGLGLDPIDPAFDAAYLARALANRKAPVKAILLDQRRVSGIGNIYACEALFRAGLSPARAGGSITVRQVSRLAKVIGAVLGEAIDAGGSTLRDFVQASGEGGYFQHRFAVYGREGEACPSGKAGHAIHRITQSGRSTFYCPQCQR